MFGLSHQFVTGTGNPGVAFVETDTDTDTVVGSVPMPVGSGPSDTCFLNIGRRVSLRQFVIVDGPGIVWSTGGGAGWGSWCRSSSPSSEGGGINTCFTGS